MTIQDKQSRSKRFLSVSMGGCLAAFLLVLISNCGCSQAQYANTSRPCIISPILVNSCGPWLGAWANDYPQIPWGLKNQILYHEQRIGRQVNIVHDYISPSSPNPHSLSSDEIYFINRANTHVLLNWKPADNWADAGGGDNTGNADIDAMADSIKSVAPHRIFLSVWHEPEKDISSGITCVAPVGKAGTPAQYIQMWHNVRARFNAKGVTNVVWVMIYMSWEHWDCVVKTMWPGNRYVDWVAYDPYVVNDPLRNTWDKSIGRFYDLLASDTDSAHAYTSKPWMLTEWGANFTSQTPVYQAYIDAKASLDNGTYPRLKGYVVFDAKGALRIDYNAQGEQDNTEQNYYIQFATDPKLIHYTAVNFDDAF